MKNLDKPVARAEAFAARLGIHLPVLLAPMAGACPPSLSIAVANAGGMGACGALLLKPEEIAAWCAEFRAQSQGEFQINLWIPGPPPKRDAELERRQREYLAQWGPEVPESAAEGMLPDFDAQCRAMLEARPKAISSIMGLYAPEFVREMKARGILWFATATTVAEAKAAEAAGAHAIIAQGMEAGGHRGGFDAGEAERRMVGLFALLPQLVDAVSVPVIATGGIADGRGVAAALMLGASAAMIGTGFLRSPEAKLNQLWANALGSTEADGTMITSAFTGRPGRGVANEFARASAAEDAPQPAPYPLQRGLTRAMREAASKDGKTDRMQMWAGQAAKLARAAPAGDIANSLWREARDLLI
jgi:nitronate monooxygenase